MKKLNLILPFLIFVFSEISLAFWGTGMYPTAPMCPYPYGVANGAHSGDRRIKSWSKKKGKLEKKQTKDEERLDEIETAIDGLFKDEVEKLMSQAVKNNCSYTKLEDKQEDTAEIKKKKAQTNSIIDKLSGYCNADAGFSQSACEDELLLKYPPKKSEYNIYVTKDDIKGCKKYLEEYIALKRKVDEYETVIGNLEEKIEDRAADLEEKADEDTEGSGCWWCHYQGMHQQAPKPDKWQVIGGTVGALGAAALGYLGFSQAAKYNAKLGWGTQPYGALGYSFPFFMGGLYGALGGGMGAGGFGCSGGFYGGGFGLGPMGMAGPFGMMGGLYGQGMYPMSMMNPYATMTGGMFMPGMGPWGMGPWSGMMNPYLQGGIGFGPYNPYAMTMNPWLMGGMMNPYSMGGMGGMGMPWFGGGMGMPGMGMPGFGGGMGMPGMGMPWLGGGMGMPGMGMPGLMGGLGGLGGMGGMGGLGLDFQTQLLEQQLMQTQMQLEMQQRHQSQAAARMRIASDIQLQLYRLQYQLQNVLSGGGTSYLGGYGGQFSYPYSRGRGFPQR